MGIEVRSHDGPEKPELDMEITLVELDELVPHEQTIESELEWFIQGVKDSGQVYWPMLIARESNLILDGHHRTAGLKKMGFKNAPAILIDYHDDLISLDTWFPRVKHPVAEVIRALEDIGLIIKKLDLPEFDPDQLGERRITAYVGNQSTLYTVSGTREDIFRELRDLWIDEMIYYDDPEMCLQAAEEEDHTAVIAWSYNKKEILEHVDKGVVHLPKTTRHELEYKVPRCNFPIEDLDRKD